MLPSACWPRRISSRGGRYLPRTAARPSVRAGSGRRRGGARPILRRMDELRRDLEARLDGEVRFDAVSRALYSTDASVYQIRPLGVAIARSREDVLAAIDCARAHGCSITARGGGTSQAGQAIGAGLQLDTSKYLNRLLEVNVEERWARVEPGIVLDELNAQLAPHRLRFAPDISTASRATIGGMISNNSSGARSVRYGKTIDHVLDLHVALADGSVAPLPAAERRRARCRLRGADVRGRLLPDGAPSRRPARGRDRAPLSEDPAPRRRLQPRRLHARPLGSRRAVQPGEAHRRLGGHARPDPRGPAQPGPAAARESGADHRVRRPARRARRHAGHPRARSVGDRGDGPFHPRSCAREPRPRRDAPRRPPDGLRSAALRRAVRRHRGGARPAARAPRGRRPRPGLRRPHHRAPPRRPIRPGSGSFASRPSDFRWP